MRGQRSSTRPASGLSGSTGGERRALRRGTRIRDRSTEHWSKERAIVAEQSPKGQNVPEPSDLRPPWSSCLSAEVNNPTARGQRPDPGSIVAEGTGGYGAGERPCPVPPAEAADSAHQSPFVCFGSTAWGPSLGLPLPTAKTTYWVPSMKAPATPKHIRGLAVPCIALA